MTVDNNLVRFASELFDLTEELENKHPKFQSTYAPYTLQYLDSEGTVLFQFLEEGVDFYPTDKGTAPLEYDGLTHSNEALAVRKALAAFGITENSEVTLAVIEAIEEVQAVEHDEFLWPDDEN